MEKTGKNLGGPITFPVGYHDFHKDQHVNFQFNRWHSLGYWTEAETREVGGRVNDVREDLSELVTIAGEMKSSGRDLAAAFALRAAEFFTHPNDHNKLPLYDQFHQSFYAAVQDERMEVVSVPYQDGCLPVLRFSPEMTKGVILIHGGLDSFMEEFYSAAVYLLNAGYEVILFEGPGQGAALRKSGLHMTHEWEKPTRAVMDHLQLEDVTLVGLSLGGYLAPRAAAFEERISKVVLFDVFIYDQHGQGLQRAIYHLFLKYPGLYNWVAKTAMSKSPAMDNVVSQWMFITGVENPSDWNALIEHYSVSDIASRVKQDVLLLAGEDDHMIPFKEYEKNQRGFCNARSITGRVFSADEHASNHCQVGNIKLALDVILEWVGRVAG